MQPTTPSAQPANTAEQDDRLTRLPPELLALNASFLVKAREKVDLYEPTPILNERDTEILIDAGLACRTLRVHIEPLLYASMLLTLNVTNELPKGNTSLRWTKPRLLEMLELRADFGALVNAIRLRVGSFPSGDYSEMRLTSIFDGLVNNRKRSEPRPYMPDNGEERQTVVADAYCPMLKRYAELSPPAVFAEDPFGLVHNTLAKLPKLRHIKPVSVGQGAGMGVSRMV